ncbi:MAG: type I glyceraldehyde-3-phosphate dehydrogenase [Armatimonadota bacterium]
MRVKVAINGFGRIGRQIFRQLVDREELDLVAINDVAPPDNLVYLLRHDSVYPDPEVTIEVQEDALRWGERTIPFTNIKSPEELPWQDRGVEIAIESSGVFTHRDDAAKHLDAGAGYVIITAPAKGGPVFTTCLGVNEDQFDPAKHQIVSNASCTTNALAPVAKVLHDTFGIVKGFMSTVHAVTSSQSLVDAPSKKVRRGRSAILSTIPTTTGAATATTQVLPELEGRLDAMAFRVPVACGSVIDLVALTEKPATVDRINAAFRGAAQSERMRGILGITDEELVSADIIGTTYSALVDGPSTNVLGENMIKVLAWYDNEWGYARRVVDLAVYMGQRLQG